MAGFARIHCPECGQDTLHHGERCVHCGTPYERSRWVTEPPPETGPRRRAVLKRRNWLRSRKRTPAQRVAYEDGGNA